jgi:hypothetical protein
MQPDKFEESPDSLILKMETVNVEIGQKWNLRSVSTPRQNQLQQQKS